MYGTLLLEADGKMILVKSEFANEAVVYLKIAGRAVLCHLVL